MSDFGRGVTLGIAYCLICGAITLNILVGSPTDAAEQWCEEVLSND